MLVVGWHPKGQAPDATPGYLCDRTRTMRPGAIRVYDLRVGRGWAKNLMYTPSPLLARSSTNRPSYDGVARARATPPTRRVAIFDHGPGGLLAAVRVCERRGAARGAVGCAAGGVNGDSVTHALLQR
jgi:hypothetical protein